MRKRDAGNGKRETGQRERATGNGKQEMRIRNWRSRNGQRGELEKNVESAYLIPKDEITATYNAFSVN